jgi:hypothetical protein
MCWDIQISFMHKLRAVIVVILFTDISVFNNEDMLFRPFGFLDFQACDFGYGLFMDHEQLTLRL